MLISTELEFFALLWKATTHTVFLCVGRQKQQINLKVLGYLYNYQSCSPQQFHLNYYILST